MGNHDAGRAMGRAAEMALAMRSGQTALEILDMICEPYRGCDAEFEAPDPKRPGFINPEFGRFDDPRGPLGRLIIEAFGDPVLDYHEIYYASDDTEGAEERRDRLWFDGPRGKFRARYEFC